MMLGHEVTFRNKDGDEKTFFVETETADDEREDMGGFREGRHRAMAISQGLYLLADQGEHTSTWAVKASKAVVAVEVSPTNNDVAFLTTPTAPLPTTVWVQHDYDAGWVEITQFDANRGVQGFEVDRKLFEAYEGAKEVVSQLEDMIDRAVEPQQALLADEQLLQSIGGSWPSSVRYIYGKGFDPLYGEDLMVVGRLMGRFICLAKGAGPGDEVAVPFDRATWKGKPGG